MIGRTRGISIEWVQREPLAACSRDARLLHFMLATVADDYGRAPASPVRLAGMLYAHDADAAQLMPDWLMELRRAGELEFYDVRGQRYLQLTSWEELVRPDRRSGAQYPAPPAAFHAQGELFAPPRRLQAVANP